MNIKDLLKLAFPKPVIPQKRYIVALGIIVYGLAKGIVYLTPTPNDDALPDKVKDAVMSIVQDETQPNEIVHVVNQGYEQSFGEKN